MSDSQSVSRADLYERVWSTPMRKLAAEFGISDVGLAKICRKNGIPLPGLGYWRLIETGHRPKRGSLSPPQPGHSETITITRHEPKPYDLPRKSDLGAVPTIEVRDDQEITHPFAIRTKRLFEPASKDDQGRTNPRKPKAPHIRVSAAALPRVLRILDSLFSGIEKQGNALKWDKTPDATLSVVVDGEEISFCLAEIFSQKPHALTPKELADREKHHYYWGPKWDYIATGELRLTIDNLPYELSHVRKSWSDGKTRRVEKCLGDMVAVLPHIAKSLKLVREQTERERLRREEEEKRAEEARRRREEYERKAKVVAEFLKNWSESRRLRELAAAVAKSTETTDLDVDQKKGILEIAQWIVHHADNVDPLKRSDWMIKTFSKPSWQYW